MPNAQRGGVKFIDDTFLASLRTNGRQPNTGFYFDRVWVISGSKLGLAMEGARDYSRRGAGGFGGRRPGSSWGDESAPTEAVADVDAEARDVLTDESVLDDWEFEIWVDAVLQDYPEAETEDEEEPDAEEDGE